MKVTPEFRHKLDLFIRRRQMNKGKQSPIDNRPYPEDTGDATPPWLAAYHKADEMIDQSLRAARGGIKE